MILERTSPDGRLIGFDRDAESLIEARKHLARFGDRVMLVHENFKNSAGVIRQLNLKEVQGVLLDLGVSSAQLDEPGRGFSFRSDAPLDMRMDRREASTTAGDIVNRYSEKELERILHDFGEERFAGRIARGLVRERSRRPIRTTGELTGVVVGAVPRKYRYGRLHPATRTFQALRLEVNREMESLDQFLSSPPDYLKLGGRLVIISFHSLEDRSVKVAFRQWAKEKKGSVLTKHPVRPDSREVSENPRSRSAKLRAFEMSQEVI